jgi:hypothetical protein
MNVSSVLAVVPDIWLVLVSKFGDGRDKGRLLSALRTPDTVGRG